MSNYSTQTINYLATFIDHWPLTFVTRIITISNKDIQRTTYLIYARMPSAFLCYDHCTDRCILTIISTDHHCADPCHKFDHCMRAKLASWSVRPSHCNRLKRIELRFRFSYIRVLSFVTGISDPSWYMFSNLFLVNFVSLMCPVLPLKIIISFYKFRYVNH